MEAAGIEPASPTTQLFVAPIAYVSAMHGWLQMGCIPKAQK